MGLETVYRKISNNSVTCQFFLLGGLRFILQIHFTSQAEGSLFTSWMLDGKMKDGRA